MGRLRTHIDETKDARRARAPTTLVKKPATPAFIATGQSTQLIVGADDASDRQIINLAAHMYASYRLSRIYYSAFSPIPDASKRLPLAAPPLQRESRLYQSDWLLRHYGFSVDELLPPDRPNLALGIDPKLAWALAHPEGFPVDVNRAARESLLRVPGFGRRTVDRIVRSRRVRAIRIDDLNRLGVSPGKAIPFIVLPDHRPRGDAIQRLREATIERGAARTDSQLELPV
jgi:predicted DNA-binding helix-hairpin-helix protein